MDQRHVEIPPKMPLDWLYSQKIRILAKNKSLDFSEKMKIAQNGSKMGRHGMACTSSDAELNSASDDVHAVPWGPQKIGFWEDAIF